MDIAQDETIDVQRARLMVDSAKWIACKLIPDVYGDKTTQDINVVTYTQYLDQLPEPTLKQVN